MGRQLQFVHVGKCGGSTISSLLSESKVIGRRYNSCFESHVNGVQISQDCDYLICLRNPIQRAFSAFEWRKKLVLGDSDIDQVNRFAGERKVLKKYKSLNALARSLYFSDGRLDHSVSRDFRIIHHLRESISFYISPLLPVLRPDNIFGVICQESLSSDCKRLLGVDASKLFVRRNIEKGSIVDHLDGLAISNLRRYLSDDYQCISALWSLGSIRDSQFVRLMFDADRIKFKEYSV